MPSFDLAVPWQDSSCAFNEMDRNFERTCRPLMHLTMSELVLEASSAPSNQQNKGTTTHELAKQVRVYVREQANLYGRLLARWSCVRIPVRWTFFEKCGADWLLKLQDRLADVGGLAGDASLVAIVALRSREEEMISCEARRLSGSGQHQTISIMDNRTSSPYATEDIQWYDQLSSSAEQIAVVDVALAPKVDRTNFLDRLRRGLGRRGTQLRSRRGTPAKFVESIQDIIPREVEHLYAPRHTLVQTPEVPGPCTPSPEPPEVMDMRNMPRVVPDNVGGNQTIADITFEAIMRDSAGGKVSALTPFELVREHNRRRAIIQDRNFSDWPRVRVPIRMAFIEENGVDWLPAVQDRFADIGGLRGNPSLIEVVGLRTREEEVMRFEIHFEAASRHHSVSPGIGNLEDMQWCGELAGIREPIAVVELAISPAVDIKDFARVLTTMLNTSAPRQRPPPAPVLHTAGRTMAYTAQPLGRFIGIRLHDIVPRGFSRVHCSAGEAAQGSAIPIRATMKQNPVVGAPLRKQRELWDVAPSHCLRSARIGPPGSSSVTPRLVV